MSEVYDIRRLYDIQNRRRLSPVEYLTTVRGVMVLAACCLVARLIVHDGTFALGAGLFAWYFVYMKTSPLRDSVQRVTVFNRLRREILRFTGS